MVSLTKQYTHHATDDLGVHCPGDQGLLLALEESLDCSLHILLHGAIQGLGCSHAADNLSAVSGHQGSEGADDGVKISNPDDNLTVNGDFIP